MKINDSGLGWKSKAGKTVLVLGKEIDRAEWITLGRLRQLRFLSLLLKIKTKCIIIN